MADDEWIIEKMIIIILISQLSINYKKQFKKKIFSIDKEKDEKRKKI